MKDKNYTGKWKIIGLIRTLIQAVAYSNSSESVNDVITSWSSVGRVKRLYFVNHFFYECQGENEKTLHTMSECTHVEIFSNYRLELQEDGFHSESNHPTQNSQEYDQASSNKRSRSRRHSTEQIQVGHKPYQESNSLMDGNHGQAHFYSVNAKPLRQTIVERNVNQKLDTRKSQSGISLRALILE